MAMGPMTLGDLVGQAPPSSISAPSGQIWAFSMGVGPAAPQTSRPPLTGALEPTCALRRRNDSFVWACRRAPLPPGAVVGAVRFMFLQAQRQSPWSCPKLVAGALMGANIGERILWRSSDSMQREREGSSALAAQEWKRTRLEGYDRLSTHLADSGPVLPNLLRVLAESPSNRGARRNL